MMEHRHHSLQEAFFCTLMPQSASQAIKGDRTASVVNGQLAVAADGEVQRRAVFVKSLQEQDHTLQAPIQQRSPDCETSTGPSDPKVAAATSSNDQVVLAASVVHHTIGKDLHALKMMFPHWLWPCKATW